MASAHFSAAKLCQVRGGRGHVCRPELERASSSGGRRGSGTPVPGNPESQGGPDWGSRVVVQELPPPASNRSPGCILRSPSRAGRGAVRWEAGAAPPGGSRRRPAVYPRLPGAPCRPTPQRSGRAWPGRRQPRR